MIDEDLIKMMLKMMKKRKKGKTN